MDSEAMKVFITGMGVISAAGDSLAALTDSLSRGLSGISRIEGFDVEGLRSPMAGEVKTVRPSLDREGLADRSEIFARLAVRQAVENAGLRAPLPGRSALVATTNFGGLRSAERSLFRAALKEGPVEAECFSAYSLSDPAWRLAAEWGVQGPVSSVSLSCASGTAALGVALDLIRRGQADLAIVVGYDALSVSVLAGLGALRTITTGKLKPFTKGRDGTVFGEGAAAVVLESDSHALARGADRLARVLGVAVNNNAYHLTAPDKEGEGFAMAMRMALQESRVSPDQVDFVSAHGTGTRYNDLIETKAIKEVLGDHARNVPVHSIKPITGHMMAGAGLVEAIACVLSMQEGILFPTINYDEPDPECDLDYVPNEARPGRPHLALNNSSGIGGCNACALLEACT